MRLACFHLSCTQLLDRNDLLTVRQGGGDNVVNLRLGELLREGKAFCPLGFPLTLGLSMTNMDVAGEILQRVGHYLLIVLLVVQSLELGVNVVSIMVVILEDGKGVLRVDGRLP